MNQNLQRAMAALEYMRLEHPLSYEELKDEIKELIEVESKLEFDKIIKDARRRMSRLNKIFKDTNPNNSIYSIEAVEHPPLR